MTKLDRLRVAWYAVFFGGLFLFWPLNALVVRPNTEAFYGANVALLLAWGTAGTVVRVLWHFYQCPACLQPFFLWYSRPYSNKCARCGHQLTRD